MKASPTAFFDILQTGKYSDVDLIVGDDKDTKIFKCHKVIMAARSSYFSALLFGGMKETSQSEIKIKEDPELFELVLEFIYTGKLSIDGITFENVISVYKVMDLYCLESAKEMILEQCELVLNESNCLKVLSEAAEPNLGDITAVVADFVFEHQEILVDKEKLKDLSSSGLKILAEMDECYFQETDRLFNWISAQSLKSEKSLKSLTEPFLPHICFEELSPLVIYNFFEKNELLSQEKLKDIYRYHALIHNSDLPEELVSKEVRFRMTEGIQEKVSASIFHNWKQVYCADYSDRTKSKMLKELSKYRFMAVGARKRGSNTLELVAMGTTESVLQPTVDNETNFHNGLFWYFNEKKSFGFAESAKVTLSVADSMSGNKRLSWHLEGDGGYRLGNIVKLNNSSEFEKVIWVRN